MSIADIRSYEAKAALELHQVTLYKQKTNWFVEEKSKRREFGYPFKPAKSPTLQSHLDF